MFYKDEVNKLYIDPILENFDNLTEITEEEFNEIKELNNLIPVDIQEKIEKYELEKTKINAINTMRIVIDDIGYQGNEKETTRLLKKLAYLTDDESVDIILYDETIASITNITILAIIKEADIMLTDILSKTNITDILTIIESDPIWLEKYINI